MYQGLPDWVSKQSVVREMMVGDQRVLLAYRRNGVERDAVYFTIVTPGGKWSQIQGRILGPTGDGRGLRLMQARDHGSDLAETKFERHRVIDLVTGLDSPDPFLPPRVQRQEEATERAARRAADKAHFWHEIANTPTYHPGGGAKNWYRAGEAQRQRIMERGGGQPWR